MSSFTTASSEKMVPSLSTLEEKGIEIEEDPSDITELPPYANDLRELLLNFKEIVPINRVCQVFSEHFIMTKCLSASSNRRRNWSCCTTETKISWLKNLIWRTPSTAILVTGHIKQGGTQLSNYATRQSLCKAEIEKAYGAVWCRISCSMTFLLKHQSRSITVQDEDLDRLTRIAKVYVSGIYYVGRHFQWTWRHGPAAFLTCAP